MSKTSRHPFRLIDGDRTSKFDKLSDLLETLTDAGPRQASCPG